VLPSKKITLPLPCSAKFFTDSVHILNKINEASKIINTYKVLNNDLIIENKILNTIEEIKKTPQIYKKYFKENYVTLTVIHINIKHKNYKDSNKIELYRIFDNFIVSETFPFIQYYTPEGKLIFKFIH
jgi:hypothetical protein